MRRKLVGKPIGNPGIYGNGLCELFDGSRITYYAQDPSRGINYVGMDFGKPVKITRIVYYPHTDDNGVVPDELYELFYWGSGCAGYPSADKRDVTTRRSFTKILLKMH